MSAITKPRVVVFASGTLTGGGSGFEKLVEATQTGVLDAEIVAVVSQYVDGGVFQRAARLRITPSLFPRTSPGYYRDPYRDIARTYRADYYFLSGWALQVRGLDPRTTINIHPAPLPRFGGKGWYGHRVHERMLAAYRSGEIGHSAVSMHFVDAEYDHGPIFFQQEVEIKDNDTPETLAARVNVVEHRFQAAVSNLVVTGQIAWDGVHSQSLRIPSGYVRHRPATMVDDERLTFSSATHIGDIFNMFFR